MHKQKIIKILQQIFANQNNATIHEYVGTNGVLQHKKRQM
jgi:hypothetical protein